MAVVAVDFVHLDLVCAAGDVLADDHPLVAAAPHLFVQPAPVAADPESEPVRIRGPLAATPKRSKESRP